MIRTSTVATVLVSGVAVRRRGVCLLVVTAASVTPLIKWKHLIESTRLMPFVTAFCERTTAWVLVRVAAISGESNISAFHCPWPNLIKSVRFPLGCFLASHRSPTSIACGVDTPSRDAALKSNRRWVWPSVPVSTASACSRWWLVRFERQAADRLGG
jgi:hypothetical protein